ncbi:hypothetical protein ACFL5V_11830 [Fibrobacterota bacterium]
MNQEEKQQVIDQVAVDVEGRKKIPCALAFEIHRQHEIPLKEIGEICNDRGIKISSCQLGCFR